MSEPFCDLVLKQQWDNRIRTATLANETSRSVDKEDRASLVGLMVQDPFDGTCSFSNAGGGTSKANKWLLLNLCGTGGPHCQRAQGGRHISPSTKGT